MPANPSRQWRPQFSLQTFFMFCLLIGVLAAWVSDSNREYVAEQRLIKSLISKTPRGGYMAVAINGETKWVVGSPFM